VYDGSLLSAQGHPAPRSYGMYVEHSVHGQDISCIVLQYWGRTLRHIFFSLDVSEQ